MFSFGSITREFIGRLAAVRRERDGAVLIYVAGLLPILIGGGLMSVDAARLYSLHSFLQAGADALALAGATELDGQSQPNSDDSITRANRAIANIVSNHSRFGDNGYAAISVASTTFLKSLPATDGTAVAAANITTDPTLARYAQVKVAATNFTTIFPQTLLGAVTSTSTTAALATAGGPLAGAGRQICLGPVVPMFICNPYEGNATSLFQATNPGDANYATNRRRQILLQTGSGSFAPGNYGWLDTPELGNGATALRDALALVQPISGSDCRISRTTISQKTGNIANADDAMNTRFDLWSGPFNSKKNDATYAPAANVRKGAKPGNGANGACSPSTAAPNANSLPRDSAFTGRVGNGSYSLSAYWTANYGGSLPAAISGPNTSRYDVYLYEKLNNKAALAAIGGPAIGEKGTPQCNTAATPSYDRRLLYVAIVNCTNLAINGNSSALGTPVAYGKFFLTEPVSGGNYYAELVGLTGTGTSLDPPGDSTGTSPVAVSESVQLYR